MSTAPVPGTPRSTRAVLPLAAGFAALEGYDLACYGVTVPSMLADRTLGADKAAAGTVGALVAVGMLVGAAVCAATIRQFGSRRLLLGGATLFSVAMLVCAVAPTFAAFGAARLVVGIGLGIVLPTVTAYVADHSAPGRRARDVGLMMSGYAAGALLAPLLGAAILGGASWHWIYIIGGAPALLLVPIAIRLLPESPVHGTDPGTSRGALLGLRPLLAPGVRGATLLFWVVSFCGLLLVFGISTWLPTIMQTAGYSSGSSLLQTAAMWVGAGLGMVAGGRVADRIGIKPVVTTAFLAGAVALIAISARPPIVLLFLLVFVAGLGFIGSQVLTNAFIVSHYPPELRGPAIGWALSVGRLGAVTGPLLGAAILTSGLGVAWNFYLFAVPGVLGALLAAAVPAIAARRSPAVPRPTVTPAEDGSRRAEPIA